MKLEAKYLAAYLPHELKVIDEQEVIRTLRAVHSFGEVTLSYNDVGEQDSIRFEEIKPILRPLADLTREIEHNGERFVPIEYISTSKAVSQRIMRRVCNEQSLDNLEYWQAERLFELHFDVFNLIPAGLAIDINEINK